MKVIIKTLTGERFELDIEPEDTVKDLKARLFRTGKVTKVVRLLQGQTVLQDDLKISEYNIQDGDTISALFEPDVDINIEITEGQQICQIVVPNSTSVMALKLRVCDLLESNIAAEKMELVFGDVTLEDNLPVQYFNITSGSTLSLLKPHINVIVENNHGEMLYHRIDRNMTMKDVKQELGNSFESNKCLVVNMRRYFTAEGQEFNELTDDSTVKDNKMKDGDKLYLLSYKWTTNQVMVMRHRSNFRIHGVEIDDTILGVKLRVQDQMGIPVRELYLAFREQPKYYVSKNNRKISSFGKAYPINVVIKTGREVETERVEAQRQREEEQRQILEEQRMLREESF